MDFNPRSPHGERLFRHVYRMCGLSFQPTLPARGATTRISSPDASGTISTHAPRTGSDVYWRGECERRQPHFNPRSPHGERLPSAVHPASRCPISTHAPRTGSDVEKLEARVASLISTHAPRTGSDKILLRCRQHPIFQPTLPARGATPCRAMCASRLFLFQPTLPARGATLKCGRARTLPLISTHAPRTGSDVIRKSRRNEAQISTHAPRTGSDEKRKAASAGANHFNPRSPHGERLYRRTFPFHTRKFQPTLPARGATVSGGYKIKPGCISTHAPRTGSDHTKQYCLS